jgi:small-conductance mechanosensitive channel
MVWQQQSFPSWQVVQVCIHVHELTHIPSDIACALCLQFVNTLETNILTSIGSVVNVTITNVVLGSISVSNTIAFTAADSIAAAAGQTALAQALSSGDVSLFGTTFGPVTVSDVKQANATNPGEFLVSHAKPLPH